VDPWGELLYPRVSAPTATVLARGLQRCSECGRLACPTCLRVVEQRADDFFFDQFACLACLRKAT